MNKATMPSITDKRNPGKSVEQKSSVFITVIHTVLKKETYLL